MRRSGGAGLSGASLNDLNWVPGITAGSRLQTEEALYIRYRAALPERLRSAVLRALRSVEEPRELAFTGGGPPLDVHHVVAANLERAAPGRLMLRHWQVEVHSTVNAAILPRSFHQGHGLHRGPFLEEVNRRMLTADGVARMVAVKLGHSAARHVFIDMLKKLGDSIVAGTSDPVAISLQAVLRTSDRAHGHVTQYGTIAANA